MNLTKKILLASSFSLISTTGLFAEQAEAEPETLKQIMQSLLKDTQQIAEGIVQEDFQLIAKAASHIANHPKAPMTTRKKIAATLGNQMSNFKGFDIKVHTGASSISKAAELNDMSAVMSNYQTMLKNCLACHKNFKEDIITVLK